MRKNKIAFAAAALFFMTGCGQGLKITVSEGEKYIVKNRESSLVVNIASGKEDSMRISFVIHNLTDDATDMPIFKKQLVVYPGRNVYVIRLSEIGTGRYSLRLVGKGDRLLDYRILEIQ